MNYADFVPTDEEHAEFTALMDRIDARLDRIAAFYEEAA